jgi:hypothetical protein
MNLTRILLGVTAFGLIACTSAGCSSSQDEDDSSDDALANGSAPGQWVVDMKKVSAPDGYGRSSSLFFGLSAKEYLCQPNEPEAQCAQKPALWDQTFHFGPQASEDGSVAFRKPFPNDKVNPVVKLADGSLAGPKGKGLNIIPLLKNTDPTKQVYLRKWLKNGDVLTFFHPEQTSMRNLMDRRASHVAMHYDYTSPLNGKEFVHHIDNPNNYGPRYNYQPSRNMPFHVFRYQPKGMEAKKAEAYALAARNWAFIDDDRSPFADFFDLQLQSQKDLKSKFVDPLLAGHDSAEIYCSGLAFTNMNLGTNYPLRPGTLTQDYAREETGETFKASDCANGNEDKCVLSPAKLGGVDVTSLESRKKLVLDPYTTGDLATAWLDNTYGELPLEKRAEIAAMPQTQQLLAQGLYNLTWSDGDGKPTDSGDHAPAAVTAPENLKAWGDAYGATLVVGKALKAGDTGAAGQAVQAFIAGHQLRTKTGELVGLADLIQKHNAGAATAPDPEKWIPIDPAKMSPSQILRALEMAHIENRYVPPRIWMDTADDRMFLPSGYDPRTDSQADMVYVGTVINCELLAAADGSDRDACAVEGEGVGSGSDQFSEGGADTSTYPHYAIANDGERTHRRFDASTGPALIGKGTKLTVRATTYEMNDVKFLLHTPGLYAEGYPEYENALFNAIPPETLPADVRQHGLAGLNVTNYDTACTAMTKIAASQQRRGSCAPKRAIYLDPAKSEEVARGDGRALTSGAIPDAVYTFDLTKICRIPSGDSETMTCPVVSQKPDGSGWDFANVQDAEVSRTTHGLIAATMVDVGAVPTATAPAADAANPNNDRDQRAYGLCSACGTGGAHFNPWTVSIRNDR